MTPEKQARYLWEKTHKTRPAMVGKVKEKRGTRFDLELADGRVIKGVGNGMNLAVEVDMFVTFNFKGDNYQILQPAPYGF